MTGPVDDRPPILVIEDNATTRKTFRLTLESAGYRVVEAHDARMALAAIEHVWPSLIIQDLNLPDMDGLELSRSLRERLGDAVPIVCVSGFLSRLDEARAVDVGIVQILVKPVAPMQLLDVAKIHLTLLEVANFGLGRRVLVVDDDPLQRQLSQIWLESAGFEVSVAADGTAALAAARSRSPEIVLSDVLMPGLDGFGLCFALRTDPLLAHIPVVLSSAAYVEQDDRELAFGVGAAALITKNDGRAAIMQAIGEALQAPPRPRPKEAVGVLEARRANRALWQLERQLLENARLRKRTEQQEAQLSVLAGVAESLARNNVDDAVIGEALASCLDTAGISKGALYTAKPDGHLVLQHQIGFSELETSRLHIAFGCLRLFGELADEGHVVLIPSERVSEGVAQQLLIEIGTSAVLVVPVTLATKTFGVIILGARLEDVSGEDALAFARVLGAQMGQAIGLSRSFASLAAGERRYRSLTENANDSIAILTPDGVIRECNRRLAEFLGYASADELVGLHIRDLAAPGHAQSNDQAYRALVKAGPGRSPPTELQRKDGTIAVVEFSNAPVTINGEELVLTIGRDVTEQVQVQSQLMVSDRMASVGALAAGVAHEINNPLAAATMNLELADDLATELVTAMGASPQLVELQAILHDAREAADRVRLIVKDLRIFSRAEKDQRGPVDLHHVLESTLRMAWNEIRHRAVLVKRFGDMPRVEGNESRLGQVFLNLIVNAAQAIPEGHVDRNRITISTSTNGLGTVVIEFRDTGPGIPPEILKKLFTPFFTTKPVGVGTGLGLAICHRIITGLGGTITVTSKLDEGTVVRVSLPASDSSVTTESPISDVLVAKRRGHVLLVDDDKMMGTAVQRALVSEHEVTTLTTAQDALDLIAAGQTYDVILCDLMMPHMTGAEFHKHLMQSSPE
ncbi:MAG: response regulator [Deltaproteobacteria bacterium]|nr:response regulator [Deltaproteobacteria bacterium]